MTAGTSLDDVELGSRIAHWRVRRGITQRLLADRIGRSKSWIEKVEAGTRSANRIPILLAICRELQLDLPVLLGCDPERDTRECIGEVQLEAIRTALESYDVIRNEIPDGHVADPHRLRAKLAYAWSGFELADYEVVSQAIPGLLADAQRAHVIRDGDETSAILIEVYQITASTLRKLGEYELAWLAGDRGILLADQVGDLTMSALTGFRVANALTALGRSGAAFALNVSLAGRVEPQIRTAPDHAVYGNMLLQAAMAAAASGDASGVRDLIHEAKLVATHVSENNNYHRLSFGPTNAAIHHVSALVSLGEGGLAVETAASIAESGLHEMRRERRANHLVDIARAYSQWGRRDEAADKLSEAAALAPREVYCRPMARSLIENLLERSRGRPACSLRSLAVRAGIAL